MYMKQFQVAVNYFVSRGGASNLLGLFRGPLLQAPIF